MIQMLDIEETIARSTDPASTRRCANECFTRGFSIADTYSFLQFTEEVRPDLDEEVALRHMHRIADKYPHNGGAAVPDLTDGGPGDCTCHLLPEFDMDGSRFTGLCPSCEKAATEAGYDRYAKGGN